MSLLVLTNAWKKKVESETRQQTAALPQKRRLPDDDNDDTCESLRPPPKRPRPPPPQPGPVVVAAPPQVQRSPPDLRDCIGNNGRRGNLGLLSTWLAAVTSTAGDGQPPCAVVYGPHGCGKTFAVAMLARRLGVDVERFDIDLFLDDKVASLAAQRRGRDKPTNADDGDDDGPRTAMTGAEVTRLVTDGIEEAIRVTTPTDGGLDVRGRGGSSQRSTRPRLVVVDGLEGFADYDIAWADVVTWTVGVVRQRPSPRRLGVVFVTTPPAARQLQRFKTRGADCLLVQLYEPRAGDVARFLRTLCGLRQPLPFVEWALTEATRFNGQSFADWFDWGPPRLNPPLLLPDAAVDDVVQTGRGNLYGVFSSVWFFYLDTLAQSQWDSSRQLAVGQDRDIDQSPLDALRRLLGLAPEWVPSGVELRALSGSHSRADAVALLQRRRRERLQYDATVAHTSDMLRLVWMHNVVECGPASAADMIAYLARLADLYEAQSRAASYDDMTWQRCRDDDDLTLGVSTVLGAQTIYCHFNVDVGSAVADAFGRRRPCPSLSALHYRPSPGDYVRLGWPADELRTEQRLRAGRADYLRRIRDGYRDLAPTDASARPTVGRPQHLGVAEWSRGGAVFCPAVTAASARDLRGYDELRGGMTAFRERLGVYDAYRIAHGDASGTWPQFDDLRLAAWW
jgi:hypothetical protein